VDSFLDMMSNEVCGPAQTCKDMNQQLVEFDTPGFATIARWEKTLQQNSDAGAGGKRQIDRELPKRSAADYPGGRAESQPASRPPRMDLLRTKEEISNLRSKKESIVSRLKVLLNSELELIKALEVDDDELSRDLSKGSGKMESRLTRSLRNC